MFRKTLVALAVTATLGAAALVPTTASAHGWGWGRGVHITLGGPDYAYSCVQWVRIGRNLWTKQYVC
jgi:hypothetical protein